MRRITPFLALVVALALVGAACGGDGGDGGGGDQPLANLEGQTIDIAAKWSGDEQKSFEQVLDVFEQETGATVRYTPTGEDTAAFLASRLEGGNPPDVAMLPQPGVLRDFAQRNALKPIEDLVGDVVDDSYAEIWRELGTHNGTLYGVWFKAANKSTVWYNTNSFEQAGVQPPETWEQLLERAETIEASGTTPFSVGGADGWTLTDWFENVYVRTAGPENYDRLTTHEIPWTHETVKAALRRLAEIWGKPTWIAGGAAGALQTDFPASVSQVYTTPPKAAIVYEGDFVAGVITAQTQAKLGEDANFFTFPSIDGSDPAVIGGGDVAVLMKDTQGGQELIKFLASARAAEAWARLGGFTSPNKKVDLDAYPDAITRKSAEALTQAEVFRFDLSDLQPAGFGTTPGKGLFKHFQDFLRRPTAIDQVTQAMEREAAAAFR